MENITLIETIERYINSEMSIEERSAFEQLRLSNTSINQQIQEYQSFIQHFQQYSQHQQFKTQLQQIQQQHKPIKKPTIVYLWNKYKRTIAVAACIAGITTLITSSLLTYFNPKTKHSEVQELVNKVNNIERKQTELGSTIERTVNKDNEPNTPVLYNGTGFLIDGKGYLITSAHVIKNTKNITVQNYKGQTYKAQIISINNENDLAFIKITDEQYKPITKLPYTIRKTSVDLGEQIYTLGYPRNEIVYGEGYTSAATGYNGDTISYQIAISANPGNSGGPILNKNGEVIGVLSARQLQVDGVVFAVRSINIYRLLNQLKQEDIAYQKIKLPINHSSLNGLDKTQQIKRVKDCVFMIKGY